MKKLCANPKKYAILNIIFTLASLSAVPLCESVVFIHIYICMCYTHRKSWQQHVQLTRHIETPLGIPCTLSIMFSNLTLMQIYLCLHLPTQWHFLRFTCAQVSTYICTYLRYNYMHESTIQLQMCECALIWHVGAVEFFACDHVVCTRLPAFWHNSQWSEARWDNEMFMLTVLSTLTRM